MKIELVILKQDKNNNPYLLASCVSKEGKPFKKVISYLDLCYCVKSGIRYENEKKQSK